MYFSFVYGLWYIVIISTPLTVDNNITSYWIVKFSPPDRINPITWLDWKHHSEAIALAHRTARISDHCLRPITELLLTITIVNTFCENKQVAGINFPNIHRIMVFGSFEIQFRWMQCCKVALDCEMILNEILNDHKMHHIISKIKLLNTP